MKHIHLIGIGGTGLSAIARVLLERGYTVSGSDREASPLFNAITVAGARTFLGHAAEQVAGADLVIRSSAIPDDNIEVVAAQSEGIPVLKRADFLQELTQGKDTLAVAGSHGKTTTTTMLIWILEQLGTEPSFISGGMVNQLGCNARAGNGLYFAIEADEYDYMFLGLSPKIAIITNIEHDHPDCFPTEEDYRAAFKAFLERVRPDGLALLCIDDPDTRALMKEMAGTDLQILGYGTSSDADYLADEIKTVGPTSGRSPQFTLKRFQGDGNYQTLGRVTLCVPGHHNVLNATGALGAVDQLGLSIPEAILALSKFTGAGRRFEVLGKAGGVTIIDDYGHHPTQIGATIKAACSRYPGHRIWAIWQPHTFSRTESMEEGFIRALDLADRVLVLKIYASREEDPGYSSKRIAEALPKEKAVYGADFNAATNYLLEKFSPGDVAIVFSAGDATQISRSVLNELQKNNEKDQESNR